MSAGPTTGAGFATTSRGSETAIAVAGCRLQKGSWRSRSRRSARLPSRSCLRCSRTRRSCFAPGRWRRWSLAPSSAASRCETSNRCARRRGSASSRSRPRRGSARSCASASSSSSASAATSFGLVALFLDAIFLNVRPKGPKEGVLCAWGFTEEGERVLVGVCLGMRESHEDWLSLTRDLIARGLGAPMLVVGDGAPGLIKAVEQCWPSSDRQHCSVHRARNLMAKLSEQQRERVRRAYWKALDEAKDERDGRERLAALVAELERAGYASAARCLADDLDALVAHLRYPLRHRKRWRSTN